MKAATARYEISRWFAERGYVVVTQDVRGRGDSDGIFDPYFNDVQDGYDTIEWCAVQPWCDGKVGAYGGSCSGRIQWLAALEQPSHQATMMIMVAPSDPFVETPTDSPSPMHLCWLHYTSGRANQVMEAIDWNKTYTHLPLLTMDEAAGRARCTSTKSTCGTPARSSAPVIASPFRLLPVRSPRTTAT